MHSEPSPPATFLLCRSRLRLCAIPLHCVRETMRALPLEPLPDMPAFMLGVSVIRGQVVPVVDLASLTGQSGGAPGARLVTLELNRRQVALAADDVLGVRSLEPESLGAVPPLLGAAGAGVLGALATLDAELLLVLEAARLIPDSLWPLLDLQEAAA